MVAKDWVEDWTPPTAAELAAIADKKAVENAVRAAFEAQDRLLAVTAENAVMDTDTHSLGVERLVAIISAARDAAIARAQALGRRPDLDNTILAALSAAKRETDR